MRRSKSEESEKPEAKLEQEGVHSQESPSDSKSLDSTSADSDGVKYRLTFLANSMFKGKFYQKDESIIVPEHVAKAYKGRTMLQFTQL